MRGWSHSPVSTHRPLRYSNRQYLFSIAYRRTMSQSMLPLLWFSWDIVFYTVATLVSVSILFVSSCPSPWNALSPCCPSAFPSLYLPSSKHIFLSWGLPHLHRFGTVDLTRGALKTVITYIIINLMPSQIKVFKDYSPIVYYSNTTRSYFLGGLTKSRPSWQPFPLSSVKRSCFM